MSAHDQPQPNDGFYVGYLPLPPRHARALKLAVPALALLITTLAAAFAAAQRSPGPAVWDTATLKTWTGTLIARPYPMLVDDDTGVAHLLVEAGKSGPRDNLEHLHAHRVSLEGFSLHRDERRMIELEPPDDATNAARFTDLGPAATPPPAITITGPALTLHGEILDSKCYLGAMKPGDGVAHKACATLCIRGRIPPMFFRDDPDAATRTALLVTPDLAPANDAVIPYAGEPVTITATPATLGTLPVLILDPGSIARR